MKNKKANILIIDDEVRQVCSAYGWPGNVRELVNCLETALLSAGSEPTLFPTHLPKSIRIQAARDSIGKRPTLSKPKGAESSSPGEFPKFSEVRKIAISEFEQTYFRDLIAHAKGNMEEARSISGLGRSRFYELLKKM